MSESLQLLPSEKWKDLRKTFTQNWPDNIVGYYMLGIQEQWKQCGLDYDFTVYCPFGEIENGMVAISDKVSILKMNYNIVYTCDWEFVMKS